MSTGELAAPSCSELELDAELLRKCRGCNRRLVNCSCSYEPSDRAEYERRAIMVLELGHVFGLQRAELMSWHGDRELRELLDASCTRRLDELVAAFLVTGADVGTELVCEEMRRARRANHPGDPSPAATELLARTMGGAEGAERTGTCVRPGCGQTMLGPDRVCGHCRRADREDQGDALELFDTRPYGAPKPAPQGQGGLF